MFCQRVLVITQKCNFNKQDEIVSLQRLNLFLKLRSTFSQQGQTIICTIAAVTTKAQLPTTMAARTVARQPALVLAARTHTRSWRKSWISRTTTFAWPCLHPTTFTTIITIPTTNNNNNNTTTLTIIRKHRSAVDGSVGNPLQMVSNPNSSKTTFGSGCPHNYS